MSYLLSKSGKQAPKSNGEVQKITPESANWGYVGFEMYHLNEGQTLDFNTENTEACFVLVSGYATISVDDTTFENLGNRHSPFEKVPPYSVYVPHNKAAKIISNTYLELAVCRAPSQGNLPVLRMWAFLPVALVIINVWFIIFCRKRSRRMPC